MFTHRLSHALVAGIVVFAAGCEGEEPRPAVNRLTTAPTTAPSLPAYAAANVGRTFNLLGRAGRPLGEMVTLVGVVGQGPWKGYEDGPNLIVQRIDGLAVQRYVRLPVYGQFANDGQADGGHATRFVEGHTYRLRGYETGEFVGSPAGESRERPDGGLFVQNCGYYFRTRFVPTKVEPVDPVVFAPADFTGRRALLAGTAANVDGHGYLTGPGWRLLSADDGSPWPADAVGKPAEVDGVVQPGTPPADFRAEHAARRLTRLEDQVGRPVALRGTVRRDNDARWIEYRGQTVYVDGDAGKRPDGPEDQLGEAAVLHGTLTRGRWTGPVHDDEHAGEDAWIVRNASWEPLADLTSAEHPPEGW